MTIFFSEGAAEISPSHIEAQSPRPPVKSPSKTVASSSPTPLFSPGSVVRVLPDTTPGVRPMHAEGMLMARVSCYAGGDYYFVTPTSIKKRRGCGAACSLLRYTISSSLHTLVFCLKVWVIIWSLRVPFLCYFGLMSVMLMRIVLVFARALIGTTNHFCQVKIGPWGS